MAYTPIPGIYLNGHARRARERVAAYRELLDFKLLCEQCETALQAADRFMRFSHWKDAKRVLFEAHTASVAADLNLLAERIYSRAVFVETFQAKPESWSRFLALAIEELHEWLRQGSKGVTK